MYVAVSYNKKYIKVCEKVIGGNKHACSFTNFLSAINSKVHTDWESLCKINSQEAADEPFSLFWVLLIVFSFFAIFLTSMSLMVRSYSKKLPFHMEKDEIIDEDQILKSLL